MDQKPSAPYLPRGVFCALSILIFCGQSHWATAAEETKSGLGRRILPLVEAHRGEVGVAVQNLQSGESFEYHAERAMPTASLIKLPIMIAAYDAIERGKLSANDMIELKKEDQVPGSGILTPHFSAGTSISVRDAIRLMIVYSDNTATNLVLDQLGLSETNTLMKKLGCPETRVNSKVFRRDTSIDKERSRLYGLGSTTARDMVKLCEQLYTKSIVSQKASEEMLTHLFACDDKLKSPRLLPKGTRVAHKTGSVNATRTDAGIIESPAGPIAFCVLTDKNKDQGWSDENEGDLLCARVAAAAYRYFNPRGETTTTPIAGKLEIGSSGELVTALQRTLNARMKPSLEIGVDGDFGPETENAVKKFQSHAGLEQSGIVDEKTWKALGPVVMDDVAVDEPAIVNGKEIKKSPRDALEGPPFVTCKGWAIFDGVTGEFLVGGQADLQREPASTTKLMTAYLVALLAESDPSILDETVTFSERADRTPGTSAEIRAGEKLSVRELLYGMMLPSGNDATVAFGEHLGDRLADEKDKGAGLGAYESFVSAMNRKAAELGMSNTRYENTHGLHSDGHVTTARDLGKLAFAAMKLPLIREVVRTACRGCTIDSVAGYQRNVEWKNTNQLLQSEGYDGIKTGTTNAAGACLVSTGERDGKRLIVVVLGSTSGDARYVDSRNLYRWAWKDVLKSNQGSEGVINSGNGN